MNNIIIYLSWPCCNNWGDYATTGVPAQCFLTGAGRRPAFDAHFYGPTEVNFGIRPTTIIIYTLYNTRIYTQVYTGIYARTGT